jgi:DnaJ-class molecular chaperone
MTPPTITEAARMLGLASLAVQKEYIEVKCWACGGTGWSPLAYREPGTGLMQGDHCTNCAGTGRITTEA